MKRSQDLRSYFVVKVPRVDKDTDAHASSASNSSELEVKNTDKAKHIDKIHASTPSTSTSTKPVEEVHAYKNDIGVTCGKIVNLSDEEKYELLVNTWTPETESDYVFPKIEEGNQLRSFKSHWLTDFSWLAYSHHLQGAMCKYCCIFAPRNAGSTNSQPLKTFVIEPMKKYKDALRSMRNHSNTEYHKTSATKAGNYIAVYTNNGTVKSIKITFNKSLEDTINKNKKRLLPIVKTVLFCARNNCPLRDDGELGCKTDIDGKTGIFRSLLAFRLDAGDKDLDLHFRTAKKNCTMISKTIQNEIIECIGDVVRTEILKKVKKSKFFTLMADESTDCAKVEQIAINLRYVDLEYICLREDFLGFIPVVSVTGESLRNEIKRFLNDMGLTLDSLRGQGYDGGSNMSGKFNGLQALISQEQPKAFYTHCFNHKLNLVLNKSCKVQAIFNTLGTIGKISTFLSASAKRVAILKEVINRINKDERKKKLKPYCETRWVERHDSILVFDELFHYILETLDEIGEDRTDQDTSTNANAYALSMRQLQFITSTKIAVKCFSITLPLSKMLQDSQLDLSVAQDSVLNVISVLQNMRSDASTVFTELFNEDVKVCNSEGVDVQIHRITKNQKIDRIFLPRNILDWLLLSHF